MWMNTACQEIDMQIHIYIYIYIFRNCSNLDVILKACMKQKLCFSQHSNPIQPQMLRIDQCNCDFPIDKSNSNAMTFIRHEKRAVKRSSLNHTEYVVKWTRVIQKMLFVSSNGNFRILKWMYCTISGNILLGYSLT